MRLKLITTLLICALMPNSLWAARPSINELNTRVNQLEAKVDSLESKWHSYGQIVFVDANGTIIGDAQNYVVDNPGIYGVRGYAYFEIKGQISSAPITGNTTQGLYSFRGGLLYDQLGCTGNAYVDDTSSSSLEGGIGLGFNRDGIFYKHGSEIPQADTALSVWDSTFRRCTDGVYIRDLYLAVPILEIPAYTEPFKLKIIPGK